MRTVFDVVLFKENIQGRETVGDSSWFPIPRKDDTLYTSRGDRVIVKRIEYHLDKMTIYIIV